MPEFTVKILAISVVFLVSGIKVGTDDMRNALMQVKRNIVYVPKMGLNGFKTLI